MTHVIFTQTIMSVWISGFQVTFHNAHETCRNCSVLTYCVMCRSLTRWLTAKNLSILCNIHKCKPTTKCCGAVTVCISAVLSVTLLLTFWGRDVLSTVYGGIILYISGHPAPRAYFLVRDDTYWRLIAESPPGCKAGLSMFQAPLEINGRGKLTFKAYMCNICRFWRRKRDIMWLQFRLQCLSLPLPSLPVNYVRLLYCWFIWRHEQSPYGRNVLSDSWIFHTGFLRNVLVQDGS